MKKLSTLLVAFTLGIFIFSSCTKDGNPTQAPTITVNPADDTLTVSVGDTVKYSVSWSCPDDILSAKISYKAGTTNQIILDSTFAAGTKSCNYNFNIEIPNEIPEETIIELDFFGNSKDESTVVKKYIKVHSSLKSYTNVTMQAQADGPISRKKNLTFYSTGLNKLYTLEGSENEANAANIDIVFTHHSIFKTNAQLAFKSPDFDSLYTMWHEFGGFNPPYEYDLTNKNRTYFKKVTVNNWDNLNNDKLEDVIGDIGTDVKLKDINVGDYIAFETHDGKKGILKITNTDINHNPYEDTYVTFDVKVQR